MIAHPQPQFMSPQEYLESIRAKNLGIIVELIL